jgi:hypothetical protein
VNSTTKTGILQYYCITCGWSEVVIVQSKTHLFKKQQTPLDNDKHFPVYEYSNVIKLATNFLRVEWVSFRVCIFVTTVEETAHNFQHAAVT